ncbi:carabin isoform X2 [Amia ocellicauda]|uniref:carabin isoform X2 n=1 Tax=Amia ocellicauda TaxID=2972642 RepID=UPI003464C782
MLRRRSSASGRVSKRRPVVLTFDEFGFAEFRKKDMKLLQHRCHEYSCPTADSVKARELCDLLSYWNGSSFICRSQIERYIKMGIPPELRGRVWKCLLNIHSMQEANSFNYQNCLKEIRKNLVDLGVSEYNIHSAISILSEAENEMGHMKDSSQPRHVSELCSSDLVVFKQIALDLQRSFPTHRSLMGDTPEAIEGQAKLFRVLTAYARYNPQTGYSQGMSYLAAVLLMNLSEEEAFWALVALLETPKYLSGFFDHSLDKIQYNARVFHQLLKHRMPRLSRHIEDLGVSSLHYVMPWFLTLFTSLPCWDSVLAVWDLIMLHGVSAVFRTGLCILQLLESRLLHMSDVSLLLPTLLRVPVDVSRHSALVPALWTTEVQDWEIECMRSLVLEEDREEPGPETLENGAPVSQGMATEEKRDLAEVKDLVPNESSQSVNAETAGSAPKNIFTKMLRVARRYLVEAGKVGSNTDLHQPTSHRSPSLHPHSKVLSSSASRGQIRSRKKIQGSFKKLGHRVRTQSSGLTRCRGTPMPSALVLDGEMAGERPDVPLKRGNSGPAGRVGGRRTTSQRTRGKSLRLVKDRAGLSPPVPRQAQEGETQRSAPACESLLEATHLHSSSFAVQMCTFSLQPVS